MKLLGHLLVLTLALAMITAADKFTLMLGLQTYIGDNYSQDWGPFAAGAVRLV